MDYSQITDKLSKIRNKIYNLSYSNDNLVKTIKYYEEKLKESENEKNQNESMKKRLLDEEDELYKKKEQLELHIQFTCQKCEVTYKYNVTNDKIIDIKEYTNKCNLTSYHGMTCLNRVCFGCVICKDCYNKQWNK